MKMVTTENNESSSLSRSSISFDQKINNKKLEEDLSSEDEDSETDNNIIDIDNNTDLSSLLNHLNEEELVKHLKIVKYFSNNE